MSNDDAIVPEDVEMADEEEEEGGIRIGDIYLPPPPPPACTFDSTGPRLIITHIENDFFKSYAGKQVLGPFHKSFTSIVGPNGSGKSNVIDSMLFVFGYRAQKIRSKKISVLIHNSETHPNVQCCSVSVHFQKIIDKTDDEFEYVPNTKFVISRTAYKDNSSFYQINGKRCQFKAVAKLLRSHGIDLDHNRFLILQGEVEQIAMMRPKAQTEHDTGMLEYLEDIVGSSRFKEPIELLSKRVEELNEQRGEKLNRVKLVEKEKDELEEPKNEAVAFIKMENDIIRRKNELYHRHIYDCKQAKEKAEDKKKEFDDEMAELKKQLDEINGKKKEREAQMKSLGEQLEIKTRKREELHDKFNQLDSEDKRSQEELKHKNQMRKKIKSQLETEGKKLRDLEKLPEENEKKIEECEVAKEKLEGNFKTEREAYNEALNSLNTLTKQLQEDKEKEETKLIDLRKVVDETRSAQNIAQSELDIFLSTEKNEQARLKKIEESLTKVLNDRNKGKEEISKLSTALPNLEKQYKQDQQELQQIVPKLESIEKELSSARYKLEEMRSANTSQSRGRVLDALLAQKRLGNLTGILGRLGDLGGINEKYDVAISTACGALDNIVVDNADTAESCINFLRKNNVGLGTFIALDKMNHFKNAYSQPFHTPPNTHRLFDLVSVKDEQVKPAFYFALRNTLVANDLDQATQIAYGRERQRVVTLKGQLIEPSGTLSGGGKNVMRGRMGKSATVVNINPQEVGATEDQVKELTEQSAQLKRQRSQLEDSMQRNGRDINSMKMSLQKFSAEIKSLEEQSLTLKKQLKEQHERAKNSKADETKVSEMNKVIEEKTRAYEKACNAAQKIEDKVDEIHKEIEKKTGGKMKGLKKKMEEVQKHLDKMKKEITRLTVEIKTAKRDKKKTEDKIASMTAEKEDVENHILQFKSRKEIIEVEAKEVLDELQGIKQEELELTDNLNELKGTYDEIVKEETKIKTSKIEFDQKLEKYTAIIKDNKAKINHWKRELSKLKLQEVPVDNDEEESMELKQFEQEDLDQLDPKSLETIITSIEDKIAHCKPNLAVLAEYRKKEEIYLKRVNELQEITSLRDEQRKYHEDLRKQRLNEFMSGFTIISNKLKEMYQMITLGGDAELELVDSLDPFSEGIVFSVRPPKKSWKNITNLSGGEKTLSSLALVFALHYYKPTPLYVMDEIDAALDFKNVSIVGNYIKERTKNAQFIIISLRSQMFELADRLVGIYKTYNCTKSVAINPGNYGSKGFDTTKTSVSSKA